MYFSSLTSRCQIRTCILWLPEGDGAPRATLGQSSQLGPEAHRLAQLSMTSTEAEVGVVGWGLAGMEPSWNGVKPLPDPTQQWLPETLGLKLGATHLWGKSNQAGSSTHLKPLIHLRCMAEPLGICIAAMLQPSG